MLFLCCLKIVVLPRPIAESRRLRRESFIPILKLISKLEFQDDDMFFQKIKFTKL